VAGRARSAVDCGLGPGAPRGASEPGVARYIRSHEFAGRTSRPVFVSVSLGRHLRERTGGPRAASMHEHNDTPSPWILRWAHLVAPGARVLDVACGGGRHARLFAARGAQVEAVDRDPAAVAAVAGVAGVHAVRADIEAGTWPYADRQFDAVIVTNYLHRPLLPALRAALAPAGVLLYETFAQGNEEFGKPSNPDFLLAPGELLRWCAGLHVLAYEDGVIGRPRPARVQRICARAVAGAAALQGLALQPGEDG
jgi:SAM-dependent methyltransferase